MRQELSEEYEKEKILFITPLGGIRGGGDGDPGQRTPDLHLSNQDLRETGSQGKPCIPGNVH